MSTDVVPAAFERPLHGLALVLARTFSIALAVMPAPVGITVVLR
eukprot:CAMPEP_0183368030 /NCGR_PEP_ID=MMETSP0164_2-20130417/94480_1 /TAXON_ID=221442 /ORGANISM="Coccolithus pelagicus ssp braarudi, Strain PLY182g" /LENGTH=43 /DNA_ID= /DNA_START= /DNA_END= /DNA_ORIENTATION=